VLPIPVFEYAPEALTTCIEASGIFTILLKSGRIVHFSPQDPEAFCNWLLRQGIPDIRAESFGT